MTRLLFALGGALIGSAAVVAWAEWPDIVGHFREGGKVTEVVRW